MVNSADFNLPNDIIEEIKEQFQRSERSLAESYSDNLRMNRVGPEDAYTGQLNGELKKNVTGKKRNCSWKVKSWQLKKVPESKIGADIIFEVEIEEEDENGERQIKRKIVLIQSKMENDRGYQRAAKQAGTMIKTGVDGRFGVFSERGIDIYDSKSVLENGGRIKNLENRKQSLGDFFGDQVLKCKAGTRESLDELQDRFFFRLNKPVIYAKAIGLYSRYFISLEIKQRRKN